MDREKHAAGATRMVVETDGWLDPNTLFTRIKSAGYPIQGVKPVQHGHGQYILFFDAELTSRDLFVIQRDILFLFARGPSEGSNHKNGKWMSKPVNKVRSFNHRHHR